MGGVILHKFEMIVNEFKTKLGRDLYQKEIEWIQWVVEQENIKSEVKSY